VVLSDEEREQLEAWARRRKSAEDAAVGGQGGIAIGQGAPFDGRGPGAYTEGVPPDGPAFRVV